MAGYGFAWLCLLLMLTGCTSLPSPDARLTKAKEIAAAAGFTYQIYDPDEVAPAIAYWQKGAGISNEATIYIAGDGYAWASRSRPSDNPTPLTHLTLKLAAVDSAPQIFMLARPGQYLRSLPREINSALWTQDRFSPDIVAIYGRLLDALAQSYGIEQFNLIGYSGGAGLAALIAAGRNDIASFRSVAGNLDNDAFIAYHDVSAMPHSLNPLSAARQINHLPQIHFIGERDKIVPPILVQNWLEHSGDQSCIQVISLKDVAHNTGWIENWPALLLKKLGCYLDSARL